MCFLPGYFLFQKEMKSQAQTPLIIKENEFNQLHPWFITGLTDAEASFSIFIRKDKKYNTGWCLRAAFQLGFHTKDKALLNSIRSFFKNIGHIRESSSQNMVNFEV